MFQSQGWGHPLRVYIYGCIRQFYIDIINDSILLTSLALRPYSPTNVYSWSGLPHSLPTVGDGLTTWTPRIPSPWLLTKVWLKKQIFCVSKHSLSILLYPALYSRKLICIDCLKEQSCLVAYWASPMGSSTWRLERKRVISEDWLILTVPPCKVGLGKLSPCTEDCSSCYNDPFSATLSLWNQSFPSSFQAWR